MKKRKYWFTMLEVILVLMIISTALISVITGVARTVNYVSEMKQRTLALNLAKEGIETVYNIRDTNWRRWSATKDKCRLKVTPLDGLNEGCEDDPWITAHTNWVIEEQLAQKDRYFSLTWWDGDQPLFGQNVKPSDVYTLLDQKDQTPQGTLYRLYLQGGKWIPHNVFEKLNAVEKDRVKSNNKQGKFYRAIRVLGLYEKNSNRPDERVNNGNCTNWFDNACGSSSAKELRFCSTVFYTHPYQGTVNICAIMTNFLE